ncbi:MAG: HD domain-containing protein [Candidatus Saccharimonadales bacterium]
MQLTSLQAITDLHKKYAPAAAVYELVHTHCKAVWDIALQLIDANDLAVDRGLVKLGCMVHDIGVYELYDKHGNELRELHYITHGTRGEEILRREGFPETICRFASHHTGVGLTAQDILKSNLPIPLQDYLAETPEEALVMYADKFHSKSRPPHFNSYAYYKQYVLRFGKQKAAAFESLRRQFGMPDLNPLAKKYGHELQDHL